jgi:putative membrane protein
MIIKKVFNPLAVAQYLRVELIVSTILATFVYASYVHLSWTKISLPFSIAAILGSALAIFIAFRNQSSYGRWWEARTLWGGIVNSSRVFARLVRTFTDSHKHQQNYEEAQSEEFKRNLIKMQVAWVHALRFHLRKENNWEILEKFLIPSDYAKLLEAQNKPNFLQTLMGEHIYQAMSNGILGGFDSFQMEGQLLALANYQGGCERIKNTPLLRQYHFFTKLFLLVFMLVLPFSLIGDFVKMEIGFLVIPLSVLISFVFATMAKVGEVNEDPFENKITDVPMTALCNTIERDLLETLGEKSLPNRLEPQNGFLF